MGNITHGVMITSSVSKKISGLAPTLPVLVIPFIILFLFIGLHVLIVGADWLACFDRNKPNHVEKRKIENVFGLEVLTEG